MCTRITVIWYVQQPSTLPTKLVPGGDEVPCPWADARDQRAAAPCGTPRRVERASSLSFFRPPHLACSAFVVHMAMTYFPLKCRIIRLCASEMNTDKSHQGTLIGFSPFWSDTNVDTFAPAFSKLK